MIALDGKALNINAPIVGVATTMPKNLLRRKNMILVSPKLVDSTYGYACIITREQVGSDFKARVVHSVDQVQAVTDGDILLVTPSGRINIMYQSGHADHTIFITNLCNSRCIMCPQPSHSDPPDIHEINDKVLSFIEDGSLKQIGITGGEPTLVIEQLCKILTLLQKRFPEALISLLTNGRRMSDFNLVRRIAATKNKKILFCIPLYADNDSQHDEIVGVSGAFSETLQGMYNLYRVRKKIEIRIVLMKQNYMRLPEIAEFIYRNLPFVAHVAFMGMEYTGEAEERLSELWIDPVAYREQLCEAVWNLHRRNMNVSIYNIPLCLLKKEVWGFARDSISEWKKNYLEQCANCSVKDKCGGVFATSKVQSENIVPMSL